MPAPQLQVPLQLLQLLLLAGGCCVAVAAAGQQPAAGRTLRPQDVDRVLANDRLLTSYINCVLDKAPCTHDGRELRRSIPQALLTNCAKCSPNLKVLTERVIRHLRAKRPRDWASLTAKFDPQGEYERRYAGSSTTAPPTATATAATAAATTPGESKTPRSAPSPSAATGAKSKSTSPSPSPS